MKRRNEPTGAETSDAAQVAKQHAASKRFAHLQKTEVEFPHCIHMAGDSQPAGADWHPILRPMRRTCERMIVAGDRRGETILGALSALNGRRSFWRGSAHEHFPPAEREGSDGARN